MKYILSIILLTSLVFQTFGKNTNGANTRNKYNFNAQWLLHVGEVDNGEGAAINDSEWKHVSLPYAWNQDEAFKNDIVDLSTGIAWYRKHFKLNKNQKGSKVFVEFEGVRQAAKVYINGHYLGVHENGITAFGYDISDYVEYGKKENIIAVHTDNSWDYREISTGSKYQWNNKNFNANYGGIPKNVMLHVTGKVYQTLPLYNNLETTGQYIYASNMDVQRRTAKITTQSQVINELSKSINVSYEVEIEDVNGKLIKKIDGGIHALSPNDTKILSVSTQLSKLNFWSWGYGYLYNVRTLLKVDGKVIDAVNTRTGFRKTEFANGLFKLNDRVLMVKGYAQRTSNEWPSLGMSVPPWMSDYSNKLMVESNGNLVRWMHITPWKQDVESCDRVGLIQAMPAGDSEKDVEGRRWEHRVDVMRDAIIYNRNNPSIIFYECGNEDISEAHMAEMKAIRDTFDLYGGRAIGSREMLDSREAEYGGEMLYINKSNTKPVWAMEYMRDEGLRKYWDDFSPPYHKNGEGPLYKGKDASAYNQNQDAYAYQIVRRWHEYFRERPGTGDRVSSGGVNIVFSETNTHHRGEENYRRSGEVDALRIPKDGFYAHQTIWNGWVDIEEQNTHIVGHWNYKPGVVKPVYVVSSGEKVEVLVNGKSQGFGKKEHGFMFTYDSINWESGKIEALSYDKNDKVVSSDLKTTSGEPASIKLTVIQSPNGLLADGADVAIIEAEVVDKNGKRCPIALNVLNFELDGVAQWLGGMAQGPDNYIQSKTLPVECGVNRVLIRSATTPGEIKLIAKSDGLRSDTVLLTSQAVEVKNGLSLNFPAEKLPVNLEKGPTPLSPSYTTHRQSIKITGVEAGSNQQNAALSFDGKQSTRWVNDGKLETGWIKYLFEEKTKVDEIAIKLSGWRTRSYPIVVSSNDTIIYQGLTHPNLGFFYISLKKPVETDHIKVRLFGQTEFKDVYNLVEITGKLDKETANDMAIKSTSNLNIVEIEMFRKVE